MAGERRDGVDTALLLLEILRRIPRNRKVSASEIHEQLRADGFDRDIRTIQRHLDTLSERFDIERDDRAKPYGYRWKERAVALSLPSLSPKESLLLKLAHDQLRQLLPPQMTKAMAGFFEQAERNLGPGTSARKERAWLRKVRVVAASQPLLPPEIQPEVFETVAEALFENRLLDIEYRNAAGVISKAQIMPLGIAQQGTRTYLVCRYEGYDDERILAMNRFIKVTMSSFSFDYPKDFDLEAFDADGRFGYGSQEKIRLTFRIDKDEGNHLTESRLSSDQTILEHEDCYEISATVIDSMLLNKWLLGFGEGVWDIRKAPIA